MPVFICNSQVIQVRFLKKLNYADSDVVFSYTIKSMVLQANKLYDGLVTVLNLSYHLEAPFAVHMALGMHLVLLYT